MNKQVFSSEWAQMAYFSMENALEMIFWVRSDGTFQYVNPAVCKALGYTSLEMSHLKVSDILTDYDDDDRDELRGKIDEKGKFLVRASITRKDGSTFPVESLNNSIRVNGEVLNCAFVRDISDQVSIEKAMVLNQRKLWIENELLRSTYELSDSLKIVGTSKVLVETLERAFNYAKNDITVLINGESGVGKESMARFIHLNSKRRKVPMVTVNCATLTSNDVISQLFGHVKGAFTGAYQNRQGLFELADGGTLFLDEVGELTLEVQAMLLRVIQSRTFTRMGDDSKVYKTNARIIAATNRDLKVMVQEQTFREDLYYRLNVLSFSIPPLRERSSDLEQLITFKLAQLNKTHGLNRKPPTKQEIEKLESYSFPGNIRELFSITERAYFSGISGPLSFEGVIDDLGYEPGASDSEILTLEEIEKRHILKALAKSKGQKGGPGGAAEMLGLNRNTLNSKMRKLGIKYQG